MLRGCRKPKRARVDPGRVVAAGPVGRPGPPCSPSSLGLPKAGDAAEAGSYGLIQTLSKVAFHGAQGAPGLCSRSLLVALDREINPLPSTVWTSHNTGTRTLCVPRTGSTYVAGRTLGSQVLQFPCKKVTSTSQAIVQICLSIVQNIL